MNREAEILFHELADLSPVQRETYLQERQVPADLRTEVEALLGFDTGSGHFLTESVAHSAEELLHGTAELNKHGRCGAYRLRRLLGRGGMGSVYLGERADGEVEQRVAIKFLRFWGDEPALRDRFLRERQILATLSHDGIARLVDAGHTEDGQPYLAMDYIDGTAIDVYAEKLGVHGKVALFIKVCEAVSYAHQHLVIHRDIKPSNILVDAAGQPKLLDFGIAKLLENDEHTGTATLLTREWGGALTPEYAAPEQVAGGPVTTAIDVYALGVLLFVLLTGKHPAGPGRHTYADLLKALVDSQPARVSDVVVPLREDLRRLLRGDLDTIVAKALKKNPQERYSSVTTLAEDLRRYLRHEPIAARPDTLAYRTSKFVRRNRTAVALGTLALITSVAGVVGTLIQARTARVQRDFALRQLSRAEAINDLNSFVLSDAAPSGKPFTVDDLLGRAKHIIERQRGNDSNRVELLISIGRQYTVQDEYAKARSLLEEAYRLSRALPDRSNRSSAACALAQTLSRMGEIPRAEALLQEGLNTLPNEPQYALDRIFCLERGSEIAHNLGDARNAIARAQAAHGLLKQLPVQSELAEVNILITLAGSYSGAGQHREAAAAFEQAAARLAALGRDDTQRAGAVFNNWGVVLILAGRPLDAEKAYKRAIDIARANGTDETVQAMSLVNYGRALYDLGRLDEAGDYAERGYAKALQAGDEVPVAQALLLRAGIYRGQGDLGRSTRMLSEVEPRLQRTLPPGHVAFASLASERALNAQAVGDLRTALDFSNLAVAIVEASIKAGRQGGDRLPSVLARRSDIEFQLGRADLAAADAAEALRVLQKTAQPGTFSSTFGRAYLALGRALRAQGKRDEAGVALRAATEHLQNALGPDHPIRAPLDTLPP
jgi:serine/threonine protein kinase/tetratricopeptide (TPR) repeat protein